MEKLPRVEHDISNIRSCDYQYRPRELFLTLVHSNQHKHEDGFKISAAENFADSS